MNRIYKVVKGKVCSECAKGAKKGAVGFTTLVLAIMAANNSQAANTINGDYSTAMGFRTTALGEASTAMGSDTTASGQTSTAMGFRTTALGEASTNRDGF